MPSPPCWVYLDTNVLIDLASVLNGWQPPNELTQTDAQVVAAARIFFYGYRTRSDWFLVVSGEGRRELTARGAPDWTLTVFLDMDDVRDSPTPDAVATRAAEFRAVGIDEVDARHLARADLTPWVRYLVTNDKKLLKKAKLACDPMNLTVASAIEAEHVLNIRPGERPPVAPAPGSPLAENQWWIPAS